MIGSTIRLRSLVDLLLIWFVFGVSLAAAESLRGGEVSSCESLVQPKGLGYDPIRFLEGQVQRLIQSTSNEGSAKETPQNVSLKIDPSSKDFLKLIYDFDVIEASNRTALLADKLIMGRILRHYLNDDSRDVVPNVMGFKELLAKESLVTVEGHLKVASFVIVQRIKKYFPNGFVVKPTFAMASGGRGVYFGEQSVIDGLNSGDLYKPRDWSAPHFSKDLLRVGSGERFMIMGLIEGTKVASPKSEIAEAQEMRIHSFYGEVLRDASSTRWYTEIHEPSVRAAEDAVQALLNSLPLSLRERQAWSFDVFVDNEGLVRVVEVNTNRGLKGGWSGFLRTGQVLGAHVRWLEQKWGWTFEGISGELMRRNWGSARKLLKVDLGYARQEWLEGREGELILKDLRELQSNLVDPYLDWIDQKKPSELSDEIAKEALYLRKFRNLFSVVQQVGDSAWIDLFDQFELDELTH